MKYKVYYDADDDCVYGEIKGEVDFETISDFAKEVAEQTSSRHCMRFLNDLRQAVLNLLPFQIFDIPDIVDDAGLDPLCRRALLVTPDLKEYGFFETTSYNRGQPVKIFKDLDQARKWLAMPSPAPAEQW
ncbi:MAG: hypothetical protein ACYS8Z_14705 [Planctomycetota bacterium]|jgi:hypothetical protein